MLPASLSRLRARGRAPRPAEPVCEPLEDTVRRVRRLAPVVHAPPRGISFVKWQAAVHAYDRLLADACRALEVEHLLTVLPDGPERDTERQRVESCLWLAGVRIDVVD